MKILLISDKVMPYRSAFYRELGKEFGENFSVLYLDDWGVSKNVDPTLNVELNWDGPILDGFKSEFVKNKSLFKTRYTGVDRVKSEHNKFFGNFIFYIRVFFGLISLDFIKKIWTDKSNVFIIEGYQSINLLLAVIIGRIKGKKLIFRGEAYLFGKKSFFIRFIKGIYLRTLFKAYHLICYSCNSNKEYFQHFGVKEKKLVFVPSAVDNDFFAGQKEMIKEKGNILKTKFNSSGSFTFLGVGRLVVRKRWIDVLKAMQLTNDPEIRLIIVGDGPEKESLIEFAKQNKIQNVYFEGFKNQLEISNYYDLADCFIIASDYDPSPKVLNEALEFGLPVILSNTIGTTADLCENNGYIFNTGDIRELSQTLIRMKNQKENLADFSKHSVELSHKFSLRNGVNNLKAKLACN